MADIKRYPGLRHFRGAPTIHVRHLRRGRVLHEGTGQSFWFRPLSAVLSEVPVDDRELPLMFHGRTADFQDVSVQATVTFRITDPAVASSRIDFSVDPEAGRWRSTPLEQIAGIIAETAQQHALDLLAQTTLDAALSGGVGLVRNRIASGLEKDSRIVETGLDVIGVRASRFVQNQTWKEPCKRQLESKFSSKRTAPLTNAVPWQSRVSGQFPKRNG